MHRNPVGFTSEWIVRPVSIPHRINWSPPELTICEQVHRCAFHFHYRSFWQGTLNNERHLITLSKFEIQQCCLENLLRKQCANLPKSVHAGTQKSRQKQAIVKALLFTLFNENFSSYNCYLDFQLNIVQHGGLHSALWSHMWLQLKVHKLVNDKLSYRWVVLSRKRKS